MASQSPSNPRRAQARIDAILAGRTDDDELHVALFNDAQAAIAATTAEVKASAAAAAAVGGAPGKRRHLSAVERESRQMRAFDLAHGHAEREPGDPDIERWRQPELSDLGFREIPFPLEPVAGPGDGYVTVPLDVSGTAMLLMVAVDACGKFGAERPELARRLDVHRDAVDRAASELLAGGHLGQIGRRLVRLYEPGDYPAVPWGKIFHAWLPRILALPSHRSRSDRALWAARVTGAMRGGTARRMSARSLAYLYGTSTGTSTAAVRRLADLGIVRADGPWMVLVIPVPRQIAHPSAEIRALLAEPTSVNRSRDLSAGIPQPQGARATRRRVRAGPRPPAEAAAKAS